MSANTHESGSSRVIVHYKALIGFGEDPDIEQGLPDKDLSSPRPSYSLGPRKMRVALNLAKYAVHKRNVLNGNDGREMCNLAVIYSNNVTNLCSSIIYGDR